MVDQIAGSDLEQRSVSDAGPEGVEYRDVRSRAAVTAALLIWAGKPVNIKQFVSGEVAEWSKAAVLKTVDPQGSGGSNPSLSARSKSAHGRGRLPIGNHR